MIWDYQAIQRTWFRKRKTADYSNLRKAPCAKLIGCFNYEIGEVLCQKKETYDAMVFQGFLSYVLSHYQSGKIVMILDITQIHHAKLIQPFLEENRARLELAFLSTYSPKLNLIEGLWKRLNETVITMFSSQMFKNISCPYVLFFNGLTINGNKLLTGFVFDYKVIF